MLEFDTSDIEKKAKEKIAAGEDAGHNALLLDVQVLLQEVEDLAFHDFVSEKYATPKFALVDRLNDLATKAKSGGYDN